MEEEATTTGYSAGEARELIAGQEGGRACVIDLRDGDDFAEAHIPSAVRVESPAADDLDEVGRGREEVEVWILVCEDGKRSEEVARELAGEGRKVGWLEGGMKAWEGDGNAVQPRDEVEFKGPKKQTLY